MTLKGFGCDPQKMLLWKIQTIIELAKREEFGDCTVRLNEIKEAVRVYNQFNKAAYEFTRELGFDLESAEAQQKNALAPPRGFRIIEVES